MLNSFENAHWMNFDQRPVFRHKAALELIEKGPILDLGCGDGLFLAMLRDKGIEGVGLETSEIAVQKARAKGLNIKKFDIAAAPLPLENNSFEAVVLLDVLEHLYQPDVILREAHRLTRNKIVVCVPNFNSLPARIQMLLGRVPENNKPRMGHCYWVSFAVVKELLRKNNFEIERLKVNSFFSWAPLLKNLMQFLAEIRPSIFALNFAIQAKKV